MSSSAVPPPTAAPPAGSAEARRKIDEEHRALDEQLFELTHTTDLARIAERLARLHELLVAHFATEEGPRGLHEVVSEGAAHRLPNLQQLFDEHRVILLTVECLRADVAGCLDGPVRRVLDGVAELVGTLKRHESDEEELFTEAFYTDLGGNT